MSGNIVVARAAGEASAPILVLPPIHGSQITITRLTSGEGFPNLTRLISPQKTWMVSMHLQPTQGPARKARIGAAESRTELAPAGAITILDLEPNTSMRMPNAFDCVCYCVPRSALDAFCDRDGIPHAQALRCVQGTSDPLFHQMTQMILPALRSPEMFSQSFLEHFQSMVLTYLTRHYAIGMAPTPRFHGGLAPWQKRRVAEAIGQDLGKNLRVPTLAEYCGLSISHFARSFKRSFGMPVHRYLLSQRMEMAKTLLSNSDQSLPDVALQVGFSDQSAMCRAFGVMVGTTPRKWRSEMRTRSGILVE